MVDRASGDMLAPADHDAPAPALPLHDEGGAPGADFLNELYTLRWYVRKE